MKVKTQDSTRVGQTSSQYPRLQQQPGNDSAEMGRQLLYIPQESPDTFSDPISVLFGSEGDDLDDGDYSPEEYEAFVRLISGIEIPQQMGFMGRPPLGSMSLPVQTQVQPTNQGKENSLPVAGPSNSSQSVAAGSSSFGQQSSSSAGILVTPDPSMQVQQASDTSASTQVLNMATDFTGQKGDPTVLQSVEDVVDDTPKIHVRLRKSAGASEARPISNDGLQILENLLLGHSSSGNILPTNTQNTVSDYVGGGAAAVLSSGVPQNVYGAYPTAVSQASSLSPAPSTSSDVQSMVADGEDTMDNKIPITSHSQTFLQTPAATSLKGAERTKLGSITRPNTSPSPDTSSVSSRPIKSRPVNVDSVMERNKKNAIQARLNRQKKKAYMENLEDSVNELKSRNEKLTSENTSLHEENTNLKEELDYVKNVLANQSVLAGLLKDIGHSSKVRLSSSFFNKSSKRSSTDAELSDDRPHKVGGGICLHVSKDDVSVEMCTKCSQMANGANRYDL